MAELAHAAGVPAGVLNVITGTGAVTGEALARHMDVDVLSFTGSTVIGRRILECAAQSNLKEVCLEMGGKSAAVVLGDATDIGRIAAIQANAIFWNMGENCTANSRIIAHKDVCDDLVAAMAAQVAGWPMGDQLDPATRLGLLVSDAHVARVAGLVNTGKAQGARGGLRRRRWRRAAVPAHDPCRCHRRDGHLSAGNLWPRRQHHAGRR